MAYALSFDETEAVARQLFEEHLARWLSRLCRAVAHEAEAGFYRELAVLTLDWLRRSRVTSLSPTWADAVTGGASHLVCGDVGAGPVPLRLGELAAQLRRELSGAALLVLPEVCQAPEAANRCACSH